MHALSGSLNDVGHVVSHARLLIERAATLHSALSWTQHWLQAKVVHIQMCIKNIMREGDHAVTWGNPFLALLTKFVFNRVAFSSAPKLLHAIRKVMPGMSWSQSAQCDAAYAFKSPKLLPCHPVLHQIDHASASFISYLILPNLSVSLPRFVGSGVRDG